MSYILLKENDLRQSKNKLDSNLVVVNFKLIGLGKNIINELNGNISLLLDKANAMEGFYIIGDDLIPIREAMHKFVDKFCDLKQKELE